MKQPENIMAFPVARPENGNVSQIQGTDSGMTVASSHTPQGAIDVQCHDPGAGYMGTFSL